MKNKVIRSYNSIRVTETTGEKTSWVEIDSQGLIIIAHDNGGNIVYGYYLSCPAIVSRFVNNKRLSFLSQPSIYLMKF